LWGNLLEGIAEKYRGGSALVCTFLCAAYGMSPPRNILYSHHTHMVASLPAFIGTHLLP